MNGEDRKILMVSEAERIKTFRDTNGMNYRICFLQCAKTGFYYTGGFIKVWAMRCLDNPI